MKALIFDMDGTIANLYGVENWLEYLRAENPLPYEIAEPLYDMATLNALLNELKTIGYKIIVTTWLSMGASKAYNKKVRKAKKEWLNKMNFPYDELHMVKYGTPKTKCTHKYGEGQILVDDNSEVRAKWNLGSTIDATKDIITELMELLLIE